MITDLFSLYRQKQSYKVIIDFFSLYSQKQSYEMITIISGIHICNNSTLTLNTRRAVPIMLLISLVDP